MTSEHHEHHEMSSRDYEREAEATRHRLARGLAELNDRLTPGQVFDEILTYAKGGSGSFMRSLGNAARANPIPTLLIGAGCMMFLSEKMGLNLLGGHRGNGHSLPRHPERYYDGSAMGRRHDMDRSYAPGAAEGYVGRSTHDRHDHRSRSTLGSAAGYVGSAVHGATDAVGSGVSSAAGAVGSGISSAAGAVSSGVSSAADALGSGVRAATDTASSGLHGAAEGVRSAAGYVGDQASSLAEGVKQGAGAVGETVSSAAQRLRETAHDLRDQVGHGAQSVGETVHGYAGAVADRASHTLDRTRRYASEAGHQVSERTTALVNEQPLLVAAIGLAIGAAIAACLPSTRTEDEMMGEASDAVKRAARDVASEQLASAKQVVSRVAEEAKSVAEREGLTPRVVGDAAHLIGEKITKVVAETAAVGKSELRDMASGERPH